MPIIGQINYGSNLDGILGTQQVGLQAYKELSNTLLTSFVLL